MSAFAETLGIEVKDGVCSMTIDDIPMEFTETPDGTAVVGVAVIGEPPPDKREAFYEMLLQANTQLYYSGELPLQMAAVAKSISNTIDDMAANVSEALGKEPTEVDIFGRDDEETQNAGGAVLSDIEDIARQNLQNAAASGEVSGEEPAENDGLPRGGEEPRNDAGAVQSDAQYGINEASSFAAAGIAAMNRDICRLEEYRKSGDGQPLFPPESHSWKFRFPDGESMETSGRNQGDIPRVGEKIRQLCGKLHEKQIVCQDTDKGAPLIEAIRKALPEKARKAVSSLFNQDTLILITSIQNRLKYPAGQGQEQDVDPWKLPGAEKVANRDMDGELYMLPLSNGNNTDVTYDLQVSEDGTTATIVTTYDGAMSMDDREKEHAGFGKLSVKVELTIDLRGDEPEVIYADIAQKFG